LEQSRTTESILPQVLQVSSGNRKYCLVISKTGMIDFGKPDVIIGSRKMPTMNFFVLYNNKKSEILLFQTGASKTSRRISLPSCEAHGVYMRVLFLCRHFFFSPAKRVKLPF